MANFIQDFLSYNCGTECHVNYLRWAALSGIASVAGPRYYLEQGNNIIFPHDYIILIGEQGVRKSYAKDRVADLILDALPDFPTASDLTTRDALIKFMSSEETERAYTDHEGVLRVYHPTTLFVDEFKHLLSYYASSMIAFIVEIYGKTRSGFRCTTISRGVEFIERPYLNILACENTDWLVGQIKTGLITGGFSRRFTVVYEPEDPNISIPRPFSAPNHEELWDRMKSHLIAIQQETRHYTWTPAAEKFYDEWYHRAKKNRPDDKVLRGFMRTKDQKILKLVMWLDLANSSPSYIVTDDLIQEALWFYDQIEPNMPKLYVAAGRNQLAMPQQGILDLLDLNHGCMQDRELLRKIDKDFTPDEKVKVIKNLQTLGSLYKVQAKLDGAPESVYFMNLAKLAEIKEKKIPYKLFAL